MTSVSERDDLQRRLTVMLRERAAAVEVRSDPEAVLAHRSPAGGRNSARRWMMVAAATIVVLAAGLMAVAAVQEPDSIQTGTVPPTPAPSTDGATTSPMLPVDSVPETLPTSTAAGSSGATAPTPTAARRPLWIDLQPGATASLPPAPIPAHNSSALAWTGTELLVWGGIVDETPCCPISRVGAAFDPATGTWRQIATPPDGVAAGDAWRALWTGTEMIQWSDGSPGAVSAAYNPTNDTWRLIADPPADGLAALWIGDEAVFLANVPPDSDATTAFAFDPVTDEWRRLADGPWQPDIVWTGSTIIVVTDTDEVTGTQLAGYAPATDTWRSLEAVDAGRPAVIPGRNGEAATVAVMVEESRTPIALLDDRGNAIGEWPGRPAELPGPCESGSGDPCLFAARLLAVPVGGEVLLFDRGVGWAFDRVTQTWRSFPLDGRAPTWDGTEVVAADDLVFAWGAGREGLVYRAATP